MPRKLLKYESPTNRITWFTTWNYAVRNYLQLVTFRKEMPYAA